MKRYLIQHLTISGAWETVGDLTTAQLWRCAHAVADRGPGYRVTSEFRPGDPWFTWDYVGA